MDVTQCPVVDIWVEEIISCATGVIIVAGYARYVGVNHSNSQIGIHSCGTDFFHKVRLFFLGGETHSRDG
ncbi:unannotated protein [freshwater metagenome]|uniref:Unannotated protein n=1 Tax=freshwater metagenome TaxID=449393 RepID=A0A6J7N7W5_9ZZZZ